MKLRTEDRFVLVLVLAFAGCMTLVGRCAMKENKRYEDKVQACAISCLPYGYQVSAMGCYCDTRYKKAGEK